ncbi:hypothetical protein BC939DRAFT_436055 [Gamsiella multidivaricata]|uniref:uncharacterized protein n=1 Tax=Gamsiella multidivaricata TaxID=101098 RepID=UPI002220B10F|nr:uncharacterized protein BC939DRAFT_436055 [Gamsiella multidivaricata]KAG0367406.1 hypothetical protein BGZ54_003934 [Gamsiella multidivaricata]KAI7831693.1 hypothetical protein BC939DRAFT_436055 [Gamsiella multidivaricata]
MKSTALFAFAASALAAVATAQTTGNTTEMLKFTQPIASTTWVVGATNASITWDTTCDGQYDAVLQIQVNGLQQPVSNGVLGTVDCTKKGTLKGFTVPDVVSGSLYSILVKNTNTNILSYSALFSILNPAKPAPATTTTTVAVPSTTAAGNSSTSVTGTTTTTKPTATQTASAAGALQVGSTVALLVVAAAGLLL